MNSFPLSSEDLRKGILEGDRLVLAKAITLMESTLEKDQVLADGLLQSLVPYTGSSLRVGITGAPGVGKSTFIEAFGKTMIDAGSKVAVLTIDPSSQITGGSILGDKTRMQELARNPHAFIRPSPSGNHLGGVSTHTREAILMCEAAGFDLVIVETLGTGQAEVAIKAMVDFFLLLVQPGAGDELQGIKKGIVEMADAIVITKADGDNLASARRAQADFTHALHVQRLQPYGWTPTVQLCSALKGTGMDDIRKMLQKYRDTLSASGHFETLRRMQETAWFREHFQHLLSSDPLRFPLVAETERRLRQMVQSNQISPRNAARQLLRAYYEAIRSERS